MNGLVTSIAEARALAARVVGQPPSTRIAICPPATLIEAMGRALAGTRVEVGGQDCHCEPSGAFTGDISAPMLVDAGARMVILGHSERREQHGESNDIVARKARAAVYAGLEPIVCVGETTEARREGRAAAVVTSQVLGSLPHSLAEAPFAVAYEPIWAIGSGLTPTLDEIEAVHGAIRRLLVERFGPVGALRPILYGGSVKPDNAAQVMAVDNVDGALVGGASLRAEPFAQIISAVPAEA